MMYGDAEGDIAWIASAKLPIRPGHVNTKVAIDGSDAANDVQGWHSFDVNPKSINPEGGFVYSANNAPQPHDSVAYPGHYYAGNTRAQGIMDALSTGKNDWTVADAQALQLDHHSPVYRKNAAKMVALVKQGGADVPAFMDGWDGGHLASDIAPTLYYRWMYRTIQGAMYDEFEQAAEAGDAQDKFETWHKTIVSRTASPCCCTTKTRGGGTTSAQTAWRPPPTWWRRPWARLRKTSPKRSGRTPTSGFTDACTPWCTATP